jgi:hypothetical protein
MSNEKNRLTTIIFLLIFIAYASGRIVAGLPEINKPRRLADTVAYMRISSQPILSVKFWGSTRPFVFPLLLKAVNQDVRCTAAMQLGISILVWGLLAMMVARSMKTFSLKTLNGTIQSAVSQTKPAGGFTWVKSVLNLQVFAFGLILAFSLDRHIAGWDFVMMTESLSISGLVLFIALGLWLLEGWHFAKVTALSLAGFLLAFTRDTNAWLLLMLAGLLTFVVVLHWSPSRTLILAACFSIIFLLSFSNATLGKRWIFPLGNLIGQRILTDHSAVRYFESCGMPVSPSLMRLLGKYANAEDRAMFEDPDLESFRSWLISSGQKCYITWLLMHPVTSIRTTICEFDQLIAFRDVDKFFPRQYDPLMPIIIGNLFYPEGYAIWIWVFCLVVAIAAIWKQIWAKNHLWVVFLLMILLVMPHIFLTYHGDAMAPERHALSVGIQLYLAFWFLILLGLEWIWNIFINNPSQIKRVNE